MYASPSRASRYLHKECQRCPWIIRSGPSQRGAWDFAVDVAIDQFHGTLDGEARLAASWRIVRADGSEVAAYVLATSELLAEGGYQGLVDAEIALARKLAAQITASLEKAVAEK